MALDTTIGGASADSYATLAAWETYATAAGWTLSGTDAVKEVYIRRAAQYLDRNYSFTGVTVTKAQALAWPRYADDLDGNGHSILSTEIPEGILRAQMELAYIAHGGADLLATISTGSVKSESVKAGPVETATEYSGGLDRPRYPQIDGLVAQYLASGSSGATIKLGRG